MSNLFIFDIDNTLKPTFGAIPSSTLEALARLHDRGHLLALATGRGFQESQPVFTQLPFDYLVCNGGLSVFDRQGRIYSRRADWIDETVLSHPCMVCCDEGTFGHDLPLSLKLASHFYSFFPPMHSAHQFFKMIDRVLPMADLGDLEIKKLYLFTSKPPYPNLQDYHLFYFWENQDKAEGIRFLEQYDPRITYTVCFGDSHNDLKMFEYCDEGYCMRHSPDALKALANAIIDLKGGIYEICQSRKWI